jgi:hypothetical protein
VVLSNQYEWVEVISDGVSNWGKLAQNAATGGGGTPVDATYVVMSNHSTLSQERRLVAGTNITIVDGGANSTVTISASGGSGASVDEPFVTIGNTAGLNSERALTAGNNVTIIDGGANSNVTIDAVPTVNNFITNILSIQAGFVDSTVFYMTPDHKVGSEWISIGSTWTHIGVASGQTATDDYETQATSMNIGTAGIPTTANQRSVAYMRFNKPFHIGANSRTGGFYAAWIFVRVWSSINEGRMFIGLAAAQPLGVGNPSSNVNLIGVGFDDSDTTWQFMHNDAAGTATKVNLGITAKDSTFTTTNPNTFTKFKLELWAASNSSTVNYRFTDLSANSLLTSGSVTTDIPAVTTFLLPQFYAGCGLNGTGGNQHCQMDVVKFYGELPY